MTKNERKVGKGLSFNGVRQDGNTVQNVQLTAKVH